MSHADSSHAEHGHHIIPIKTLLTVFGGLIFLTVLTVITATQLDLGVLDVPVAIAIAVAKAALVVTFFMALKYDNPTNTLVFSVGTVFVLIFLTFTLFDTLFRGDVGNVDSLTIQERQAQEEILRQREPAAEDLRVAPGDFIGGGGEGELEPSEAVEEDAEEAMEDQRAGADAALDDE